MTSQWDVVIVGGGHNGLVAAFYLAQAGLRVMVVERREILGGACVTEEIFDGCKVSTCASVLWILQQKIISDMALCRHGLRYMIIDPSRFNVYPHGIHMVNWADDARTQIEIARVNRHDSEAFVPYRAFWERAASLVSPFMLEEPPSLEKVMAHARGLGEEALLEQLLASSAADVERSFFDDPRIQASFVRVGEVGDPWAPGGAWTATYWHLTGEPAHAFVEGGMGKITQSMAVAATEQGAHIRTTAEVDRILVDEGRARGVVLTSGEEIVADVVISNADPKRTYLRLLDPEALPGAFREVVEKLSTRTAYLKFHAVIDKLPDLSGYLGREPEPREAGYIHIAPSLEHFRRAHQEAMRGEPAREPIVHIQVPTAYDSTLTTGGGHLLSIWACYAPPRLANGTWDERRQEVGEALIDWVTEFVPNFRRCLREWRLFTPLDMEQRVGLTDGNIRHLDTLPSQFLNQRPMQGNGYATPIDGLYLCGSGTHPGGEVTGAPGHNAARAVLRDRRL